MVKAITPTVWMARFTPTSAKCINSNGVRIAATASAFTVSTIKRMRDTWMWIRFTMITAVRRTGRSRSEFRADFSLQSKDLFRQDEPEFQEPMYFKKKIVVVMPAYNAAQTVTKTVDEVHEQGIVDEIILVDDRSRDDTVAVASSLLGVRVHVHEKNIGYGGNQKTCYRLALDAGADIVIMLHPDYQIGRAAR